MSLNGEIMERETFSLIDQYKNYTFFELFHGVDYTSNVDFFANISDTIYLNNKNELDDLYSFVIDIDGKSKNEIVELLKLINNNIPTNFHFIFSYTCKCGNIFDTKIIVNEYKNTKITRKVVCIACNRNVQTLSCSNNFTVEYVETQQNYNVNWISKIFRRFIK